MSKKAAALILGTAAAAAGATYGVCNYVFKQVIERDASLPAKISEKENQKAAAKQAAEGIDLSAPDERDEWFQQQEFEEILMMNDRAQQLKGYYLPAENPSDLFAFCSHGYRNCGKGEFNYSAKFWHDKGFNLFLVDHEASGESEGTYIGFGYYEYQDCLKWLNYIVERFGEQVQIALHGVSMGSATVMMMSGDIRLPKNVKFTVADCGYTSAWNEFAYNLKNWHVPAFPLLPLVNAISRSKAGYDFKEADALARVKQAKVPMLFIHGGADDFVPTYMGRELYEECRSKDKDLLIVDGAEHAQSYRIDSAAYEAKVSEFIDKFITVPAPKKVKAKAAAKAK